MEDVRRDCQQATASRFRERESVGAAAVVMEEQARLCQPPQASEPSQGSAMARSSFDEMPQEVAKSAEIACDLAGLALEPPRAPHDHEHGVMPDFGNMNRNDLRKAARDLKVAQKANQRNKSMKELAEDCKRAAMQKNTLLGYLARSKSNEVPGQAANVAPVSDSAEVPGQAANAAPVSDSAELTCAPQRVAAPKERIARKPKWLRKSRLHARAKAADRSRKSKPENKAADRERKLKPENKAVRRSNALKPDFKAAKRSGAVTEPHMLGCAPIRPRLCQVLSAWSMQ